MDMQHAEVPSPGVTVFIGFASQAKLAWFESVGAAALHTLLFGFNPEDASDRSLIRRVVLTTPPFVGPFRSLAGAQSTVQPWHTDP